MRSFSLRQARVKISDRRPLWARQTLIGLVLGVIENPLLPETCNSAASGMFASSYSMALALDVLPQTRPPNTPWMEYR